MVEVVVGFLLGICGTVIWHSFSTRKHLDVQALNEHVESINRIERLSSEYWLKDAETEAPLELVRAAELKGALMALGPFYETADRLFKNDCQEYRSLDGDLFDTATGGTFEEVGHQAEHETALKVIWICHELRKMLRERRRKIYAAY